ncbi:MAG: bifunctional nuclease family protein [Chloroflexota bacterium]|jgi:bifunctional DNase/RNase|nr:bifunctional nuclease family protein [Anaerolineae bacterium]HMM27411.1 bifunctional nuclease family protein [Aggregatilineaceae bacterium]
MIEVQIDSIRVSLMSQLRVVILKDAKTGRYLPIFIGPFEAEAIAVKLQKVDVERPLTHDLLKSVITELGGRVHHIVVNDLRNDTFFARIVVEQNGHTQEIDSRPSDAIALAVRLDVPIYVEESVMDRAAIFPDEDVDAEEAARKTESDEGLGIFKDFVESLDLDDLESDDED